MVISKDLVYKIYWVVFIVDISVPNLVHERSHCEALMCYLMRGGNHFYGNLCSSVVCCILVTGWYCVICYVVMLDFSKRFVDNPVYSVLRYFIVLCCSDVLFEA